MTLTIYDSMLIAGGLFDTAGNVSANQIAVWNDSSWATFGSGTNGRIFALTVSDNQMIAGGLIYAAGGVSAISIAAWGFR